MVEKVTCMKTQSRGSNIETTPYENVTLGKGAQKYVKKEPERFIEVVFFIRPSMFQVKTQSSPPSHPTSTPADAAVPKTAVDLETSEG